MSLSSSQKKSQDFNEEKWIAQVRQNINKEEDDDDSIQQVCIFKIPKVFMLDVPELYIPQQVSIGPFHYLRDELCEMEKFKLSAAKRMRKRLQCTNFEHLVSELLKLESRIRACYSNFLDLKGETLAWMIAIDACFMIEFMETANVRLRNGKNMPRLFDYKGHRFSEYIIFQDLIMLENQIPLFVLRKVLEFLQPVENVKENLVSILMNFCKELSPLSLADNNLAIISDSFHLLDFLYKAIIEPLNDSCEIVQVQEADEFIQVSETEQNHHSSRVWTCEVLSLLQGYVVTLTRKIMVSRLVNLLTMFSWKILSSFPPVSMFRQPIEYYLYTTDNEGTVQPSQNGPSKAEKPFIEEIEIPSVSELVSSGINFISTNGGISTILFDKKMKSIHLPTICMNLHTETVLKNLVTYEALMIEGPMVLTRYTELMNGIIDTDEDVRLLRENGIIVNYLKSDSEVTNIWNGMRKSIRPTKVTLLDKVIQDINEYYDSGWKVKAKQLMNLYVFDSWKFLVCLGIFFFFFLMMIQTLLSIYRFFRF